jgi:hypothetical protein
MLLAGRGWGLSARESSSDFCSPVMIYRCYSIHTICDLLIVLVPYVNFVKTGLCVPLSLE